MQGGKKFNTIQGKSDPYATLSIGGQTHNNKTIHDGGKSPVWNKSFLFEIPDGPHELDIHVFDQKKHGSDEAMGSVNIPLIKLFDERQIAPPLTRFNAPMVHHGALDVHLVEAHGLLDSDSLDIRLYGNLIHMPSFTATKKSRGAAFSILGSRGGESRQQCKEGVQIVYAKIWARGLAAKDINGSSDPYVLIKVGNVSAKTRVMEKTLNPEWNQVFAFGKDKFQAPLLELYVNKFDEWNE
ncbi:hypothetical protein GOP47_0004987 [Adiantum capillus-veneris]|uniref:C2 domain-containing protein n=1 Tax=Adiantum capillus-veneris TaxID=13818 RepID=A0A9D4ZKZ5_ADICA|nr:hypothetical protein GOP47_0004987 [Adiantum capillus-veneris]